MSQWSLGRWVGGTLNAWLVVASQWSVGRWSTSRWVGGPLSVVSGSVKHLSVGRWSVVGGFVIRLF